MSVEEALAELQAVLGKGLHPTAISKVREVLIKLKGNNAQDNKKITRKPYLFAIRFNANNAVKSFPDCKGLVNRI